MRQHPNPTETITKVRSVGCELWKHALTGGVPGAKIKVVDPFIISSCGNQSTAGLGLGATETVAGKPWPEINRDRMPLTMPRPVPLSYCRPYRLRWPMHPSEQAQLD